MYVDQIITCCFYTQVLFVHADYIGHIKLVNEQTLTKDLVLDENEIASMRRILIHVQTYE